MTSVCLRWRQDPAGKSAVGQGGARWLKTEWSLAGRSHVPPRPSRPKSHAARNPPMNHVRGGGQREEAPRATRERAGAEEIAQRYPRLGITRTSPTDAAPGAGGEEVFSESLCAWRAVAAGSTPWSTRVLAGEWTLIDREKGKSDCNGRKARGKGGRRIRSHLKRRQPVKSGQGK